MNLPKTSFAMVQTAARRLEPMDIPMPDISDDAGLVEIEACGICGSDYEQFEGVLKTPMPVVLGHEPLGTVVGKYVLRYSDGSTEERPLVLGEDFVDWFATPPGKEGGGAVVAWRGTTATSRFTGRSIRLYKTTWVHWPVQTGPERLPRSCACQSRRAPILCWLLPPN